MKSHKGMFGLSATLLRWVVGCCSCIATVCGPNDLVLAQESDGDVDDSSQWYQHEALKPISTELSFDLFSYWETPRATDDSFDLLGDLKLEFGDGFAESGYYVFSPRARFDTADYTKHRAGFIDRTPGRSHLDFDEAYVGWIGSSGEVTVGKRIYTWGYGDLYRPVDQINPVDLLDIPTMEKIGTTSLSFLKNVGGTEIEAIYSPWFIPSRVPGVGNRWLADFTPLAGTLKHQLGFDPLVGLGGREVPSAVLENGQFGLRIGSSEWVEGTDLFVSYYHGNDPIGVYRADVAPPTVTLTPVYPRFHEFGTGFSRLMGEFEVHGETAFHLTEGTDFDDDYMEYVVGVNRSWYPEFGGGFLEEIRVTLEYSGETIMTDQRSGTAFLPTGRFIRPFQNSILSSIVFQQEETVKSKFVYLANLESYNGMFRAQYSRQYWDQLDVHLGLDLFFGDETTLFGGWQENQRVFLSSSWQF